MMQSYNSFRARLIAELNDKPIEDGIEHPAEMVIKDILPKDGGWLCFAWLSRVIEEHAQSRPSVTASIIRCIGRLRPDEVAPWGASIVEDVLRHKDAEVREAGIRALEAWGGHVALRMLYHHLSYGCKEEPWLHSYIRQVAADLESQLFGVTHEKS